MRKIKLNPIIYKKILLQANEAKFQGLTKLASAVLGGVGAVPKEDEEEMIYSSKNLKEDLYNGLWKLAFNVVGYHDLDTLDIEKLDSIIRSASEQFLNNIEGVSGVYGKIGAMEPDLPGQKK